MTSEVFSPEELQFCSIIGTALTVSDTPAFQYERPVSLRYVPDHARGTLASPWLPWPHHRRRAHQTAASGAGAGAGVDGGAGAGAGADGAAAGDAGDADGEADEEVEDLCASCSRACARNVS